MIDFAKGTVRRAASLSLAVDNSGAWQYAIAHGPAIDAHWRKASTANPNYFNGTIHVVTQLDWVGSHIAATLIPTDFKNFLYWRDQGFPSAAGVRDGFGSGLIRSADGCIVLGRQRPGNINEGLAYLPGGFIDPRDVTSGGTIDITASVARELLEETGLGPEAIARTEGFVVAEIGPHVSFAVAYVSPLTATALCERIAAHIAADPDPELAEAVVLASPADVQSHELAAYARVLLASPLAWS